MSEVAVMDNTSEKLYVMVHNVTGVRIECTENFIGQWLKRGFDISGVIIGGKLNVGISDQQYKEMLERYKDELQ